MTSEEANLANEVLRRRICYLGIERCELVSADQVGAILYSYAADREWFAQWSEITLEPKA